MSSLRPILAMLGLILGSPAWAADLGRIERSILKEPVYKAKPRYCLLVFGPEARTRVWLVLDGNVLYVDRNGNGDLTEEAERVDTRDQLGLNAGFGVEFKGGTISEAAGGIQHTDLIVRQMGFGSSSYLVYVTVEGKRRQYAGVDEGGLLLFADRPQQAPIIHFGGPLAMKLMPIPKQTLRRGARGSDLTVVVGTPGLGNGTLAMLLYTDCVSDAIHPVAEIEFPPRGHGERGAKTRVALTNRC